MKTAVQDVLTAHNAVIFNPETMPDNTEGNL